MERALAARALALIPVMALVFWGLTRLMPPVTGYALGLVLYWGLLIAALCRHGGWSLAPRWPGIPAVLMFLAVLGLAACMGLAALPRLSPHVLALVLLFSVINGPLEEAFWRGALIPDPRGWRAALLPGLIFIVWHLAPLAGAVALMPPGKAVQQLIGGAALLVVPAMVARLYSGTAGAGGIGHALINVPTFAMVAASAPALP